MADTDILAGLDPVPDTDAVRFETQLAERLTQDWSRYVEDTLAALRSNAVTDARAMRLVQNLTRSFTALRAGVTGAVAEDEDEENEEGGARYAQMVVRRPLRNVGLGMRDDPMTMLRDLNGMFAPFVEAQQITALQGAAQHGATPEIQEAARARLLQIMRGAGAAGVAEAGVAEAGGTNGAGVNPEPPQPPPEPQPTQPPLLPDHEHQPQHHTTN